MSYLDKLKKNRTDAFKTLEKELDKASGGNFDNKDYWSPTRDKDDNAYAVIRFLPQPEGEDVPWIQIWDHSFQGPTGKYYIEKSLTTIGEEDPVSEYNSKLWNSGIEENKDIARKQKRRLSYHSNIMVIEDPANPDNEGKVFKYRYGKTIFEMIKDAMNPKFPDDPKFNPFDLWEGANFIIKVQKKDGWINYDKSKFADPAPIANKKGKPLDDDALEEMISNLFSLQELIAPDQFKPYAVLKKHLYFVLNEDPDHDDSDEVVIKEESFKPRFKEEKKPEPKDEEPVATHDDSDDDEEDEMSFFEGLADDD